MSEGIPSGAAAPAADSHTKPIGWVIAIDAGVIGYHLNMVAVTTVEETPSALWTPAALIPRAAQTESELEFFRRPA
jgi:hypothetical protein